MGTTGRRSTLLTVLAAVLAVLVWWFATPGEPADRAEPPAPTSAAETTREATDPHSGLAWIAVADLPDEAHEVLDRIDDGGPFRYDKDGSTFGNFEGLLPDEPRGYYREYTVDTPGLSHRGARRIVAGSEGEMYWTQDHYESFERIRR